ncbi:hypothetical protein [Bdellovibrio sp. KM01]|uniref:hypothetical protein n=1 Tax=Bdellovibrio sp. KM01 TaxID=2748865 RepID=UPI0015E9F3A5|nr:hypothetical protein [Bdellovibrio sp. KM01]QLY26917.1 hypothetical protein HW988_07965 [Bdellovibrio sp. KM01]
MKSVILFSLSLIALCCAQQSHAMGKRIPFIQDEIIEEAQVHASFALTATDGSRIQFNSPVVINYLKYLPPASGADQSLCRSGRPSLMRQSDILIIASQIQLERRELTSREIALIRKTPRCEVFMESLQVLGMALVGQKPSKTVSAEIDHLSFSLDKKKGNYLIAHTTQGKQAAFKIASSVEQIRDAKDFPQVQILQNSSGQNLGIKFRVMEVKSEPSYNYEHSQSCTVEYTTRECRRPEYDYDRHDDRGPHDHNGDRERHDDYNRERCEVITTTRPGHRTVKSTMNATNYTIQMDILNNSSQSVYSAIITHRDVTGPDREGPCIAD